MSQAKIVELIYTDSLIGKGTEEDPYRRKYELWTKDGGLVAESDALDNNTGLRDL